MQPHRIVSEQEWLADHRAYLGQEREFTRLGEELSREWRHSTWVRVGRHSLFEGSHGRETLEQLFDGRSQLIVYRLRFEAHWEESFPTRSFLAVHFDDALPQLARRDITLIAVSRAPIARIDAFKRRMGWSFKWVSCGDSPCYDKLAGRIGFEAQPGATVFYKDEWGDVFQTYADGYEPRTPAVAIRHPCCTAAKSIA